MKRIAEHAPSTSWSADDKQIVFASNRDNAFQIYVMSADGSNVRRLTHDKGEDSSPAWAPDGAAIVFVLTVGVSIRPCFSWRRMDPNSSA